MKESSKAQVRRTQESMDGVFPWHEIFVGAILDVGSGDDPLQFNNVTTFDKSPTVLHGRAYTSMVGDANKLSSYFQPDSFSCVHASQLLEHLNDPVDALRQMLTLVKVGGHVVASWPDFDIYEKCCWPSKFNGDHKAVFSLWRKGFPGIAQQRFHHVPTMLSKISGMSVKRCELVTTNFDWTAPEHVDQTFFANKGVECWIEICLKKL